MQQNFYPLQSFEISYTTPDTTPAPYSYKYFIKGNLHHDGLQIEYHLVYTGRENLSIEEIEFEGFTNNDDYNWSGKLEKIWSFEIASLYNNTKLSVSQNSSDNLFLSVKNMFGQIKSGYPQKKDEWEYLMQEMIQGIYEVSRKETPLSINFKKVFPDKNCVRVTLQPYFNTRKILLTTESSEGNIKRKELPWPFLKEILKALYIPDYDPEIAYISEPDEEGTFIDNGEGLWYEFGESMQNPSPKSQVLEKLEAIFLTL